MPVDFDEMMKACQAVAVKERALNQIYVLAIEYEAGTITAERFAKRCCEILVASFKEPAEPPKGE